MSPDLAAPIGSARPAPSFLTAEWRDLVMLNYELDPGLLRRYLPERTELDSWHGKSFVSLVGFRFLRTRVRGVSVPWHSDFDEVNLRLYVRRRARDGERRGVVFVKEIVPRSAVAWVARNVYHENYVALPMRHQIEGPEHHERGTGRFVYEWKLGRRWHRLEAHTAGSPVLPAAGSEEALVTEHYWGYARRNGGGTIEYRVEHPPWQVWRATSASLDCDASALYGPAFAERLARPPYSAFVAVGSAVAVGHGARIA